MALAIALFAAAPRAPAHAEQDARPNALYVELFGPAGVGSLNYERTVANDWSLRIGAGVFALAGTFGSGNNSSDVALAFPVTFKWSGIGNDRHRLELGAGLVPTVVVEGKPPQGLNESVAPVAATGLVGYRFQRPDRRFLFCLGFTPLLPGPNLVVEPRLGISFGSVF